MVAVRGVPPDASIQRALESASLPRFVVEISYEVGKDATGIDAVWVSLLLRDKGWAKSDLFGVQATIENAIVSNGIRYWPYVHFGTEAELMSKSKARK